MTVVISLEMNVSPGAGGNNAKIELVNVSGDGNKTQAPQLNFIPSLDNISDAHPLAWWRLINLAFEQYVALNEQNQSIPDFIEPIISYTLDLWELFYYHKVHEFYGGKYGKLTVEKLSLVDGDNNNQQTPINVNNINIPLKPLESAWKTFFNSTPEIQGFSEVYLFFWEEKNKKVLLGCTSPCTLFAPAPDLLQINDWKKDLGIEGPWLPKNPFAIKLDQQIDDSSKRYLFRQNNILHLKDRVQDFYDMVWKITQQYTGGLKSLREYVKYQLNTSSTTHQPEFGEWTTDDNKQIITIGYGYLDNNNSIQVDRITLGPSKQMKRQERMSEAIKTILNEHIATKVLKINSNPGLLGKSNLKEDKDVFYTLPLTPKFFKSLHSEELRKIADNVKKGKVLSNYLKVEKTHEESGKVVVSFKAVDNNDQKLFTVDDCEISRDELTGKNKELEVHPIEPSAFQVLLWPPFALDFSKFQNASITYRVGITINKDYKITDFHWVLLEGSSKIDVEASQPMTNIDDVDGYKMIWYERSLSYETLLAILFKVNDIWVCLEPAWYDQKYISSPGQKKAIVAVDFGTTHTHIVYSEDEDKTIKPLPELAPQTLLSPTDPNTSSTDRIYTAFSPFFPFDKQDGGQQQHNQAGNKKQKKFPVQTVLSTFNGFNPTQQKDKLFQHYSPYFSYGHYRVPEKASALSTRIKWGDSDKRNAYLKGLKEVIENTIFYLTNDFPAEIVGTYPRSAGTTGKMQIADIFREGNTNNVFLEGYAALMGTGQQQSVVLCDIGGETIDVAINIRDNKQNYYWEASVRWGANYFFGLQKDYTEVWWAKLLNDEIVKLVNAHPSSQGQVQKLEDTKSIIAWLMGKDPASTIPGCDVAPLLFQLKEQLQSDSNFGFDSFNNDDTAKAVFSFIVFYLTSILYYIYHLVQQVPSDNISNFALCFSGLGSKIFWGLYDYNNNAISEILSKIHNNIFNKVVLIGKNGGSASTEPKDVTAKGAIILATQNNAQTKTPESLYWIRGIESQLKDNDTQNVKEIIEKNIGIISQNLEEDYSKLKEILNDVFKSLKDDANTPLCDENIGDQILDKLSGLKKDTIKQIIQSTTQDSKAQFSESSLFFVPLKNIFDEL